MTACVFLGSTLPLAEAKRQLDADYLPPVRQGDVYRAVQRCRPRMIGIVDGYFHQVPSVWHKEILWAMAEGVHVFGSASMGALRAAELHAFGMEGVGRVFEAFRGGLLEDDDEVAVVHGPAELGFVAASEAMVNIRWTLESAAADGVLSPSAARQLTAIAKSLFYPERSWAEVRRRGAADGLPVNELTSFDAWLKGSRIDAKRDDALAMLRHMDDRRAADPAPKRVDYHFEHTTMWEAATSAAWLDDDREASATEGPADAWLMDEIRLDDDQDRWRRDALSRLLAQGEADRLGLGVDDQERRAGVNAFRQVKGLHRGADFRTWLAAHGLDRQDIERLIETDLLLAKVDDRLHREVDRAVLDRLRLDDAYERLRARADAKRQALDGADEDPELTDDRLAVTLFFQGRTAAPPDDIEAYARRRGFRDGADFRRAVIRDYRFRQISKRVSFDDA